MQLMQEYVQKSMSVTVPLSDAAVRGSALSHALMPANSGIAGASTGSASSPPPMTYRESSAGVPNVRFMFASSPIGMSTSPSRNVTIQDISSSAASAVMPMS